ncbi:MAG TPA: hypothetical protein VHN80_12940 [Kineosporiaceae bacterium]|nr:hypothetical protein [Kineosporiaceae bacterium]
MPAVDPDDDTIWRFVVLHYRYDPLRRERRNVLVATYDDEGESWRHLQEINAEIERRRTAGDAHAAREHASGGAHPPGHDALRRNGHLITGALRHGVYPQALWNLPLPPNMAVMRAVEEGDATA